MNNTDLSPLDAYRQPTAQAALETRFARRIVARLNEGAEAVGSDISERLRVAREQALDRARQIRVAEAGAVVAVTGRGAGVLGERSGWWFRAAAFAPLLALVGGLLLIQEWQSSAQISVAAEVDAALLSDDLPLSAYRDAGFAEFLKTPSHE